MSILSKPGTFPKNEMTFESFLVRLCVGEYLMVRNETLSILTPNWKETLKINDVTQLESRSLNYELETWFREEQKMTMKYRTSHFEKPRIPPNLVQYHSIIFYLLAGLPLRTEQNNSHHHFARACVDGRRSWTMKGGVLNQFCEPMKGGKLIPWHIAGN